MAAAAAVVVVEQVRSWDEIAAEAAEAMCSNVARMA